MSLDNTPPEAPTALEAVPLSPNVIKLSWAAGESEASDLDHFNVYNFCEPHQSLRKILHLNGIGTYHVVYINRYAGLEFLFTCQVGNHMEHVLSILNTLCVPISFILQIAFLDSCTDEMVIIYEITIEPDA